MLRRFKCAQIFNSLPSSLSHDIVVIVPVVTVHVATLPVTALRVVTYTFKYVAALPLGT